MNIFDIKKECPDLTGSVRLSEKTGNTLKNKNYGYINAIDYKIGFKPKQISVWNKGISISNTKLNKKLFVYTIYGEFISEFDSVLECAAYFKTHSGNISRKTNQIPKKYLIDSLSSKYLIFSSKQQDISNNWIEIFNKFQFEKDKLEVFDCFDNFIGFSNHKELSKILNTTVSNIYKAIERNTRVMSFAIQKNCNDIV